MVARVTVSGAAAKFNARERERCCSFGLERLRLLEQLRVTSLSRGNTDGGVEVWLLRAKTEP